MTTKVVAIATANHHGTLSVVIIGTVTIESMVTMATMVTLRTSGCAEL